MTQDKPPKPVFCPKCGIDLNNMDIRLFEGEFICVPCYNQMKQRLKESTETTIDVKTVVIAESIHNCTLRTEHDINKLTIRELHRVIDDLAQRVVECTRLLSSAEVVENINDTTETKMKTEEINKLVPEQPLPCPRCQSPNVTKAIWSDEDDDYWMGWRIALSCEYGLKG